MNMVYFTSDLHFGHEKIGGGIMRDIIKKLLEKWSCKHEWELVREIKANFSTHKEIIGYECILICKKCGKIKRIKRGR